MAKKKNKLIGAVVGYFNYAKMKRYDTLGGTLSFFFLLSFIPLLYLCLSLYKYLGTLISNWLQVETPIPEGLTQYISFDLNAGASVIFVLATIYSASKFFLQLRKTGELVYGVTKPRTGFVSIGFSCLLVVVSMLLVSIGLLGIAMANQFMTETWMKVLVQILTYLVLGGVLFGLIVAMNKFSCQINKIKIRKLMPGILFSFIFAVVLCSVFGVYLGFTSFDKLYGIFTTVIIGAMFIYFLMQGVVIGIIINEKRLHELFVDDGGDDGTKAIVGKILSVAKGKKKKKAPQDEQKEEPQPETVSEKDPEKE